MLPKLSKWRSSSCIIGNQVTDVESVLRVTIKSVEFYMGSTEVPVLYTCTHHNVTVSLPVFLIRISLIRIRIQIRHFRTNTDPDPGFWWPKFEEKNIQLKIFYDKKLQFTYPEASIKDVRTYMLHRKPSALKRDHPAHENMKFLSGSETLVPT